MKAVREVILTSQIKSNQIKFKLHSAGSGYPVSRARGSCITYSSIPGRIWNLEVLVSKKRWNKAKNLLQSSTLLRY